MTEGCIQGLTPGIEDPLINPLACSGEKYCGRATIFPCPALYDPLLLEPIKQPHRARMGQVKRTTQALNRLARLSANGDDRGRTRSGVPRNAFRGGRDLIPQGNGESAEQVRSTRVTHWVNI